MIFKSKKGQFKRFFYSLFVFVLSFLITVPASALSNSLKKSFSANRIIYYDPDGNNCNDSSVYSVKPNGNLITWIGDSYTVGAEQLIIEKLPGVDIHAQSGKHVAMDDGTNKSGLTILKELENAGALRQYVVIALGTNDPDGMSFSYYTDAVDEILKVGGDSRTYIFTTAKTASGVSYESWNTAIKNKSGSNSSVLIADWAVNGYEDEFFELDREKIHPTKGDGYKTWLDIIYDALPGNTTSSNGIYKGKQYSLSTDQLKGLIRVAKAENGGCGVVGIKTELSIFANLNEYYRGNNSDDLVNYVTTSGWFSTSDEYGNNSEVSDEELAVAKDILVNGNRTIPPEIIEHDCIGDINGCINEISNDDGITWEKISDTDTDRAKFIKGKTVVKGINDASDYKNDVWIFWTWAGGDNSKCGDPFGYVRNFKPNSSSSAFTSSNSSSSTASSYSTTTVYNKNYKGDTVWSDSQLQTIEKNRWAYEQAANEYGFPWQVMAVLHQIENSLSRINPSNHQGIYQLYTYTDGGNNSNAFTWNGAVDDNEFLRQTKIAAGVVNDMVGNLNDDDNVKELFFQYNGKASVYIEKAINMGFSDEEAENGEGSAYVMNRFDERRDPTSSNMSPLWPGRFVADGEYDPSSTTTVFGAFVLYQALGGSTSGSGTTNNCIVPDSRYGLVSGGMTLDEAKALVKIYRDAMINAVKINDNSFFNQYDIFAASGCASNNSIGSPYSNCVAFTQYFINRYTKYTWPPYDTTDGKDVVNRLLSHAEAGFVDGGHTPRPYAVFSKNSGTYGHTGIVLGIDEVNDKIIIGESGCHASIEWTDAHEYSLSTFKENVYTYAYTDNILKLEESR